jgi:hypothetical protein
MERRSSEVWRFWGWWSVATALGWVIGIIAAILLSELLVQPFLKRETNLIVGLCVGGCTAALQVRAVRRWLRLGRAWVWGGMVMMGPPFIASVIFAELALDGSAPGVRAALWAATGIGGLAGGMLQVEALRRHTERAFWWLGGLAVAWGLTIALSGVLDFVVGGVVLGMVSGGLLVLLLRGGPVGEPDPVVSAGGEAG